MKTYLTLSAIALAAAATLSSGTVLAQAAAPAPEYTIAYNIGAFQVGPAQFNSHIIEKTYTHSIQIFIWIT